MKKHLRYRFEFIVVFCLYYFFKILPIVIASNIGGFIGRSIMPKFAVSRKARNNIKLAFPDKTKIDREKILIGMWDNLGRIIAEFPHLDNITKNRTEVIGLEIIKKLDKPCIFVSAHLANWEILTSISASLKMPMALTYREPNNPYIAKFLMGIRNAEFLTYIPKKSNSAKDIIKALKEKKMIGILVDQKLNEGSDIDFFGVSAKTNTSPAGLSLKFKNPIVMIRIERLKNSNFKVTFLDNIKTVNTNNKNEDINNIMLNINKSLEDWITDRPEQWLWLHRRWGNV